MDDQYDRLISIVAKRGVSRDFSMERRNVKLIQRQLAQANRMESLKIQSCHDPGSNQYDVNLWNLNADAARWIREHLIDLIDRKLCNSSPSLWNGFFFFFLRNFVTKGY
jgi:hypothetical protein